MFSKNCDMAELNFKTILLNVCSHFPKKSFLNFIPIVKTKNATPRGVKNNPKWTHIS